MLQKICRFQQRIYLTLRIHLKVLLRNRKSIGEVLVLHHVRWKIYLKVTGVHGITTKEDHDDIYQLVYTYNEKCHHQTSH
jgi:hypothetical protein